MLAITLLVIFCSVSLSPVVLADSKECSVKFKAKCESKMKGRQRYNKMAVCGPNEERFETFCDYYATHVCINYGKNHDLYKPCGCESWEDHKCVFKLTYSCPPGEDKCTLLKSIEPSKHSKRSRREECPPRICPRNYDPVRGRDGKIYGNQCLLKAAMCKNKSKTEGLHFEYAGMEIEDN